MNYLSKKEIKEKKLEGISEEQLNALGFTSIKEPESIEDYKALLKEKESLIKDLNKESAERRVGNKEKDKELDEFKKMKEDLEKAKANEEKAKADALAKQGEFKTLYEKQLEANKLLTDQITESATIKENFEKAQTQLESIRQTKLNQIPEDKRDAFQGASIEIIESVLSMQSPALDRSPGSDKPELSDEIAPVFSVEDMVNRTPKINGTVPGIFIDKR